MGIKKYLQFDSSYRNRNIWPNESEFEVPISESGSSALFDPKTAKDPVSDAASQLSWQMGHFTQNPTLTTFTSISPSQVVVYLLAWYSQDSATTALPAPNVNGATYGGNLGASSADQVLIVKSLNGANGSLGNLSLEDNYYSGAMIALGIRTDTNFSTVRSRINTYKYLGDDRARIVVSSAFSSTDLTPAAGAPVLNNADLTRFTIIDPTDLTHGTGDASGTSARNNGGWSPYLFVPSIAGNSSRATGDNALANTIIYNFSASFREQNMRFRPLGEYDTTTHIVSIDTDKNNYTGNDDPESGPIYSWNENDSVAVKRGRPYAQLALNGDPVSNPISYTAFNLPAYPVNGVTDQRVVPQNLSLVSGFLEIPLTRTFRRTLTSNGTANTVSLEGEDQPYVGFTDTTPAQGLENFYKGCQIRITSGTNGNWPLSTQGQVRDIVGYDLNTNTVTVSPPFNTTSAGTIVPLIDDTYTIFCPTTNRRIVKYFDVRGIPLDGGTTTTILLGPEASNVSKTYDGLYISVYQGGILGTIPAPEVRLIGSYTVTKDNNGNVTQRLITLANGTSPFSGAVTSADAYSITSGMVYPPFPFSISNSGAQADSDWWWREAVLLPYTNDNLVPYNFPESNVGQNQPVNYSMRLQRLILPNQTIKNGIGNIISFYPYVYVEITSTTTGSGSNNVVYSNNPNARRVTFMAAVDNIPSPTSATYVQLDGDNMEQLIQFKPNDTLKIKITLPNGELFKTIVDERYGPNLPNPLTQIIIALFIEDDSR